jgi:Predicted signal transduction protein with a C-terminal ATPase domain
MFDKTKAGRTPAKNVIRKRLFFYFLMSALLMSLMSFFTYNNTRIVLTKLNTIFTNDIRLTDLSKKVDLVEASIKSYLSTGRSEDLENYLISSYDLSNNVGDFRVDLTDSESNLLLDDITNMIGTYLDLTQKAEYDKRGRDIKAYNAEFTEASQIYDYINQYINKLKVDQFQENNQIYLQLDSRLGFMQTLNLVVIFAVVVVDILLITWFSYLFSEPIIKLARSANEIARGNYEIPDVTVNTKDEVNVLADAFNRMRSSIKSQMVEIQEKVKIESQLKAQEMQNLTMRTLLNEAELRSLQAQINPHFMFNTLNAGMQIAILEGAERTQLFMENLSESFRYSIGDLGRPVTLEQEIENVGNYIYILKERFADRVIFRKETSGDILHILVPRMTLQPIVENSFIYGIGNSEAGGIICLRARGDADTVVVEIEDSGPGMSEETRARILSGSAPVVAGGGHRSGGGIGLKNVISRLQHFYGTDDVIEILSSPGKGTVIRLKLPMVPREDGFLPCTN